jgi:hypothetical protein
MRPGILVFGLSCVLVAPAPMADSRFVNGLALDGGALDVSGGTDANDGRLGYFSDLWYDAKRKHWWALSDRGPGGGVLNYATRVQRFKLDVDPATGRVGGFKVLQTIIFRDEAGNPLDGIAPSPTNVLGGAFDPEGFVIHPKTGRFYVSDEYGPSLYEFSREGIRVRTFATPANVVPRNAATLMPNFAADTGNTAGKRANRGFEGLAISPDGAFVYTMLQSAMLDEGAGNGVCNRIVKFDTVSGESVAQYAYKMEGATQSRGISALVALNDHEFLVLERNNRGIGVGAELTPPNKKIFRIDLAGATDVSGASLASGCEAVKVAKTGPWLDLAANTLAELGNKVPEKWEGLAVGPQLRDGSYLLLAGTDNDYSVTQNTSNVQFDVYFRMEDAEPYATSIQCPLGATTGCFPNDDKTAIVSVPPDYRLLPGVLHAYKIPADDLGNFIPPVPPIR